MAAALRRREENRSVRGIAGSAVGRHARRGADPLQVCWRRRALPGRLFGQLDFLPVDADAADAAADDGGSAAGTGRTVGTGEVKAALILPVSASGNAGIAGQAMRNAAEMAFAEFNSPNVQLLVKDDAGNTDAARQWAQQALDEGAAIILGPLFAQSVSAVGQVARARNVPVIAFSTDANVASRGIYLLSFLPESDVARIVQYAGSAGKRSYARAHPRQSVWHGGRSGVPAGCRAPRRTGGRDRTLPARQGGHGRAGQERRAGGGARSMRIFIPDSGDVLPDVVQTLTANGVNTKKRPASRHRTLGRSAHLLGPGGRRRLVRGARFAGYRNFAQRYRARYKQDPVRTATLAYDAVALIAALVKTQGPQRFSPETLTNPSGFSGIDGLFRFRADGTNERGLAVLRVTSSGAQVISPPPRSFGSSI